MELLINQTVLSLEDNKFGKIKEIEAGSITIRFLNGDIVQRSIDNISPCMY